MSSVPNHVAIIGLGYSAEWYQDYVKRLGNRRAFADEVWGINAIADVIQCDRVFHMDDVRIQELRAAHHAEQRAKALNRLSIEDEFPIVDAERKAVEQAAYGHDNIGPMLDWLKRHSGPIYTSRPHAGYPGLVAFPLQDVINSCGIAYFNSTAAYAIAYAVHIGVKRITPLGMDFTYPGAHKAEKGRACVEFHLGIAKARGIEIGLCPKTILMDAFAPPEERIYGYDTLDIEVEQDEEGPVRLSFTPKTALPTAAEIEHRYDHDRHPNRVVEQAAAA